MGSFTRLCSLSLIGYSLLTLSPATSLARDLEGHLGVGYNSEFANSYANGFRLPGISFKYGLSRHVAFEGIFGFATTNPSNSVTALKIFQNLRFESNMNFYSMLGFGVINANSIAGFEFMGGLGVEFFIPGLENLGLAVETGVTFDNGNGDYSIKTLGVSFLDAGIHFYF